MVLPNVVFYVYKLLLIDFPSTEINSDVIVVMPFEENFTDFVYWISEYFL